MKIHFLILLLLCIASSFALKAQSLFESSLSTPGSTNKAKYQLGGYVRSGIFGNDENILDKYAEGSLELDVEGNKYGNAYAEMRYRTSGTSDFTNSVWLREGYVNLYFGRFDFRIGQQIIVWGRADGFNPTNNLTPVNFIVFSPNEDDKRQSNFVAKGVYNFQPFTFEVDWVPFYRATELPLENATLPSSVYWDDAQLPDDTWKNSSIGLKLDFQGAKFDGSLSYFNGYHKTPSLGYSITTLGVEAFTQAYRVQVFGADYSTSAGSYGLRGEFAFTLPDNKTDSLFSTPCKQLEYTLGIDREWGNFSLIAQYVGKYVSDFDEDITLTNSMACTVNIWNRMLFSQTSQWNNSVSLRPSLNLLNQTLKCELLGLYNLNTEEWLCLPKITYNISDALSCCAGAQLYGGSNNTLFNFMGKVRNCGFIELKIDF
ncbi:hypothetical protein [Labilibaculum euxinus]